METRGTLTLGDIAGNIDPHKVKGDSLVVMALQGTETVAHLLKAGAVERR